MKNPARFLWLLLPAATLAFIFSNSLTPADVSNELTFGVLGTIIADVISRCAAILTGSVPTPELMFHLVRKVAHFGEFGLLGCTLYLAFRRIRGCIPNIAATLFAGVMCALSDETIQYFVPGRSAQVNDVWLDFGGFVTAIIICILLDALICRGFRTADKVRGIRQYGSI